MPPHIGCTAAGLYASPSVSAITCSTRCVHVPHEAEALVCARICSRLVRPLALVAALGLLSKQFDALTPAIEKLEDRIRQVARADPDMRRLSAIPGVGFITAHAIVAAIGDGRQFARGRDFAAWAGMTPRQHSSAGKRRAPGLSRQGEGRLRKLFALGATTLMRNARLRQDRATVWQRGLMARRPMKVAIIAQAAKTARIAWAVLSSGKPYTPRLEATA